MVPDIIISGFGRYGATLPFPVSIVLSVGRLYEQRLR